MLIAGYAPAEIAIIGATLRQGGNDMFKKLLAVPICLGFWEEAQWQLINCTKKKI